MKLAFSTDKGTRRADNQDYVDVFVNKNGLQLAIVADGVGGQNAGDVAATMAVSHIGNDWETSTLQGVAEVKEWIYAHTQRENELILTAAKRYKTLQGMATTLVLAVVLPNQVVVANLGDSRAYMLRNAQIVQLTQDHNLASELLRRGAITPTEAAEHPGRNLVTRQLGVNEEADPEIHDFKVETGDLLMLTTDGLGKVLSDAEIINTIHEADSISDAVAGLISKANAKGSPDNITVLLGYQVGKEH